MAVPYEEEDIGTSALTGAVAGASAGAVGGPVGALAGGVIGAGIGIFQAESAKSDREEAEKDREEALRRASFLKTMAERQTASTAATGRQLGPQRSTSAAPLVGGESAAPVSAVGQGIQTSAGTF